MKVYLVKQWAYCDCDVDAKCNCNDNPDVIAAFLEENNAVAFRKKHYRSFVDLILTQD